MPPSSSRNAQPGLIHPELMTAASPGIVWVELTSKCPLNCVFCSRKLLRGNGQHMDFALFQSIMSQLETPEIIRLNYSGESVHYPQLTEAIQLASGTGAFVELVTALVSLPVDRIEPLARSGLDRLTVSLHTLDEDEFSRIYGYGSVRDMRDKIDMLEHCRRAAGRHTPKLDFAFVAMQRNLAQLDAIAEYAHQLGVGEISVHPVIRRDEIAESFDVELHNGQFHVAFGEALKQAVNTAAERTPDVHISISSRELDAVPSLGPRPQYVSGPIPPHARIFSCDQNPWETAHILANGDIVVCEVRDKIVMGNLHAASLADIWHGERYRSFRAEYQMGCTTPCDTCAYKIAYVPSPLGAGIAPGNFNDSQLFRGWYAPETNLCWSKPRSSVLLLAEPGTDQLSIRGALPPGPDNDNELTIHCDGQRVGSIRNATSDVQSIDLSLRLPPTSGQLRFDFAVRHAYEPAAHGMNDVRQLGFALAAMSVSKRARRYLDRLRLLPLLVGIQASRAMAPLLSAIPRKRARKLNWKPGLSIVIPERSTPDLLAACIRAALAAAQRLDEPAEIIVVANGEPLQSYAQLQHEYPSIRWIHSAEPLGFLKAVVRGVQASHFDWVYLLNSDMTLDPAALAEVAAWRGPDVFAVASQIFFSDPSQRREETGWTGASADGRRVDIFDVLPEDGESVRTHLYAGGGSSLFQRDLLLEFSDSSDPYGPFYWEDVEWGFRALTSGYQVLYCPRSWAHHIHRATVKQFYAQSEIERIFARNSWLFAFRNGFWLEGPAKLISEIRLMDSVTRRELSRLSTAASLARNLCRLASRPFRGASIQAVNNGYFLKPLSKSGTRPRLLLVTPYAICPAAHGGARRIVALMEQLGKAFDIIVVTDEGSAYQSEQLRQLPGVTAVHLVNGRPDDGGTQDRIKRIQTHSHPELRTEVARLIDQYAVDVVQIEYMELAGLIEARTADVPWFITLHDVLLSPERHSKEDRFECGLLAGFSGIVACTEDDAKLVPGAGATVIPNGAKLPNRPYRASRGSRTILFAGPFRYEPNHQGIVTFLEKVYPKLLQRFPDLQIDILGGNEGVKLARSRNCFQQAGVRVHPFTDDVQPFLERCALTINPLLNTRGSSLKLVESLAHGRVCVSTRDGASGFSASGLTALVQVERIEDFENAVEELLTHEETRVQREIPLPDLAQRFGWEHSAFLQTELYRRFRK